jgi:ClpP class serine protease
VSLQPVGWSAVADDLQNRVTEFRATVAAGFAGVDDGVVAHFKDDELSGRRADDTGLNIRTGRLHDSIKSLVEVADHQIAGIVYNTGARYWEFHQDGAGNNPKRLHFEEYFRSQGLAAYSDVVEGALMEAFA